MKRTIHWGLLASLLLVAPAVAVVQAAATEAPRRACAACACEIMEEQAEDCA